MKRLQRLCHAWAIKRTYTDIDGKVYVGFVGPYYGNTEPVSKPLPMAMFATRREAREHQKKHWGRKDFLGDRERCRVVPVQIAVIEQ